jgi:hypothetical protein
MIIVRAAGTVRTFLGVTRVHDARATLRSSLNILRGGKKRCEKRKKPGSFQCENERKTFTFFNRTLYRVIRIFENETVLEYDRFISRNPLSSIVDHFT